MHLGRLTTTTAIASLIAVLPAAAPAQAASKLGCRASGATTIKRSRYARIFRAGGRSYGCLFSRGQAFRLGDESANESAPDSYTLGPAVRLAGRYAAYEIRFSGRDQPDFSIRVLDLRTGRVRRAPRTLIGGGLAAERADGGVTDIVLNAHGSVAWIVRDIFVNPVRLEVFKADTTTSFQLLEASQVIDPESLALKGAKLTWCGEGAVHIGHLA